jgi:hypothetical protein
MTAPGSSKRRESISTADPLVLTSPDHLPPLNTTKIYFYFLTKQVLLIGGPLYVVFSFSEGSLAALVQDKVS